MCRSAAWTILIATPRLHTMRWRAPLSNNVRPALGQALSVLAAALGRDHPQDLAAQEQVAHALDKSRAAAGRVDALSGAPGRREARPAAHAEVEGAAVRLQAVLRGVAFFLPVAVVVEGEAV